MHFKYNYPNNQINGVNDQYLYEFDINRFFFCENFELLVKSLLSILALKVNLIAHIYYQIGTHLLLKLFFKKENHNYQQPRDKATEV